MRQPAKTSISTLPQNPPGAPEENGHITLFRISKSILAFNSPVFADMLPLPDNAEVQEMYDGVPVVRVTDSAEEWQKLVAALYNPQ